MQQFVVSHISNVIAWGLILVMVAIPSIALRTKTRTK